MAPAHFCIVTDGLNIVDASRKHLLAPDEHFFDYQRILQRLESQVVHLVYLRRQSYPQLASLSISRELFGGSYPRSGVPPIPGVQPVQTGIYYTPDIEFCAFDLALTILQQTASQKAAEGRWLQQGDGRRLSASGRSPAFDRRQSLCESTRKQ
ncbi:hypothetical protein [Thermosporothrix hazakensis]|uniref:hypothetical protein n=1 Tax=Thermosporothrix hazakensis TaxID=644383 RepID=UPI001B881FCB|nr:hypothetical protein [Thermosporothrix hazakensis]